LVTGTDCVDAEREAGRLAPEVSRVELEAAPVVSPVVPPPLSVPVAKEGSYDIWDRTLQRTKRYLRIISGFVLLIAGAVMFFTPAPGWIVILAALGILAAEYVWARVLLDRMKEQGTKIRDFVLPRQNPNRV
jgi:hypothetical protein